MAIKVFAALVAEVGTANKTTFQQVMEVFPYIQLLRICL
jgi:hypothetical protein